MLIVVAVGLVLTACAGNGEGGGSTGATTAAGEETDASTTTTTETGPPPITAAEQEWTDEINRLAKVMSRATTRDRVFTNAAMSRLARTFLTCSRSLKGLADAERLEPAARLALAACEKFERSARALKQAVGIEEAGISSQEQADTYSALVDQGIELMGNGTNTMERARFRAEQIVHSIPR